ncbi:hypothetical protein L1049_020697 [Liquidambar formosana]|uniref:GDSL esterase/lipase n=1 Tax=Liquidambar formosana TaxID=63359 RepID=A0AAP0XA29_LIQFO
MHSAASAFHLPSPNPYMKKDSKFDYGASFAAKGANAMNTTFFVTKGIQLQSANHSLEAQFLSFAAFLNSTSSFHQRCMKKLGRALFFVDQVANNDYKYSFLQGKSIKEKLIDAGATNLLVPGSLPMGCLPGYLTMFHKDDPMQYDDNNCLRGLNIFTRLHNDHLRQELMELTLEYPDVHIVYADYFYAFLV